MAQVKGVYEITGVAAIEVNGDRYELVEGPAKKGDIAKVVHAWGSQIKGAFYPVIQEDHFLFGLDTEDKYVFIEGEVADASNPLDSVHLFRKVASRPAAGTKVRLIAGGDNFPLTGFVNGEVYEVTHPEYDHTRGNLVRIVREDGYQGFAKPGQLEVFVAEETPKLKTEKRHAKVGERILIVNSMADSVGQKYEDGSILTVTDVNGIDPGDVHVEGESVFIDYKEYEVIVEEKQTPKYNTEKRPAKIGERILIVVDDGAILDQTHELGDVLTVTGYAPYATGDVFVEEQPSFIDVSEYEVIIEDKPEVAEVKPEPEFKVGDKVRLALEEGETPEYGFGGVSNGEEGVIVAIQSDLIKVDFPGQEYWSAKPSELEIIEHKFQVGDIVLVDGLSSEFFAEIVTGKDSDGDYEVKDGEGDQWYYEEHELTLIAKASNREDQ